MNTNFRCELFSWNQIYKLTRRLFIKIREAQYQPDIIVAIARGGYIPARILCDFMEVSNLTSIRIEHYKSVNKKQHACLSEHLCINIHAMKVLLVDDVSDTGDTLRLALNHLESFRPAEVKSAILHHKVVSDLAPDFYAEKVINWRWIIYPWAAIEDVTGLVHKMKKPPETPEEAAKILEKENSIKIPTTILEDVYKLLR
ncbi:MAG: phosphoribosyltransferase [Desulfobacterales bacterium]|nr:phosphoribosyltransferase [Desulfobacterales bacterium]